MWYACWAAAGPFLDGYALCRLLATSKQVLQDAQEWRPKALRATRLLQTMDAWLRERRLRFPGVLDGAAARVLPLRYWAPTDTFELYRLGLYLSMSCELPYVASTSWTKAWLKTCPEHLRDKGMLDIMRELNYLGQMDAAEQRPFNDMMEILCQKSDETRWLLAPTEETNLRASVVHNAFVPDQDEETSTTPALFIVFQVEGFPAVLCVGSKKKIAALEPPPTTEP